MVVVSGCTIDEVGGWLVHMFGLGFSWVVGGGGVRSWVVECLTGCVFWCVYSMSPYVSSHLSPSFCPSIITISSSHVEDEKEDRWGSFCCCWTVDSSVNSSQGGLGVNPADVGHDSHIRPVDPEAPGKSAGTGVEVKFGHGGLDWDCIWIECEFNILQPYRVSISCKTCRLHRERLQIVS